MYSLKCKECILYFLLNNFSLEFRDVLFLFFLTLWLCRLIYMVSKWLKYREQKKNNNKKRHDGEEEEEIRRSKSTVILCPFFFFFFFLCVCVCRFVFDKRWLWTKHRRPFFLMQNVRRDHLLFSMKIQLALFFAFQFSPLFQFYLIRTTFHEQSRSLKTWQINRWFVKRNVLEIPAKKDSFENKKKALFLFFWLWIRK